MARRKKTIAFLGIITLGIALVSAAVFIYFNRPGPNLIEDQSFEVNPGESLSSVAQRLEDRGYIQWTTFFELFGRVSGLASKVKSGIHQLPAHGTSTQLLTALTLNARPPEVRITIPEGYTSSLIADRLAEYNLVDPQQFIAAVNNPELTRSLGVKGSTLEGYLFPDTYLIPKGFTEAQIVQLMVERFFEVIQTLDMDGLSPAQLHQTVIMASIVEREYRASHEAGLIASVFYNRIEQGIRLESCATIVYVLTEELGQDHPNRIFHRDLEIENPYNTYRNSGLPPSPISNPGLVALQAAHDPPQSDYLFFVLESPDAPEHRFSRSYDEHLDNRSLLIKQY